MNIEALVESSSLLSLK